MLVFLLIEAETTQGNRTARDRECMHGSPLPIKPSLKGLLWGSLLTALTHLNPSQKPSLSSRAALSFHPLNTVRIKFQHMKPSQILNTHPKLKRQQEFVLLRGKNRLLGQT